MEEFKAVGSRDQRFKELVSIRRNYLAGQQVVEAVQTNVVRAVHADDRAKDHVADHAKRRLGLDITKVLGQVSNRDQSVVAVTVRPHRPGQRIHRDKAIRIENIVQ